MEKNISCLSEACDICGVPYKFIDTEKNFIRIMTPRGWEYFDINRSPLNSEVMAYICKDKMHSYELFRNVVTMPKTKSFLDFDIDEMYKGYLAYPSIELVKKVVEEEFDYPVVVKPNQGALGVNVYLCEDESSLERSLSAIFNQESKDYDYVALVQQFISAANEYRLICLHGKPVLAYVRGTGHGFNAQYWKKGERAVLVEDDSLVQELYGFVKPIFDEAYIGFVGFDIIRDRGGNLYLIELNSSPKFNHLIEGGGREKVVDMYVEILGSLCT